MIQLPEPVFHATRSVSLSMPSDVEAAARDLVTDAGISLSLYLTALLRADLASRKKLPPESARNIQLPNRSLHTNCRPHTYSIPRDVLDEARRLVDEAGIPLSVYVSELLRTDLAARKARLIEANFPAA